MPYGTMKARTGDPHQWIEDRLLRDYDFYKEKTEPIKPIFKLPPSVAFKIYEGLKKQYGEAFRDLFPLASAFHNDIESALKED